MKNKQVIIDLKEYERLKALDLSQENVSVYLHVVLEKYNCANIDLWNHIGTCKVGDKVDFNDIINLNNVLKICTDNIEKETNKILNERNKTISELQKQLYAIKSKWWYKLFN